MFDVQTIRAQFPILGREINGQTVAYLDDVACAHGNTIGQLDESALFYMRQRGIPIKQARSLLTEAFVASVFDDVEDEDLKESLLQKVRDWLEVQL